jgi:peptidoglycan/xylan/chitin deacetylase (PgdA/CDA1 family)
MKLVLAHNIGDIVHPNYHTRQQIIDCPYPIGFDGVYKNVYDNQDVLDGKSGIFFVMGDYVGKDNSFEYPKEVPAIEQYCTWEQIQEMCDKYDFKMGWHTWSHPDLTAITRHEMVKEIAPPFPMDYFAYPYGRYNQVVLECVQQAGFKQAWSVNQGSMNENESNYLFKQCRIYL